MGIYIVVVLSGCSPDPGTSMGSVPSTSRIPVEMFFKSPLQTGFELSPDGKYYAFRNPVNGVKNLFLKEIGGGEPVQITDSEERDINRFFWGNDSWLLYLQDDSGDEDYRLYRINIKSGATNCLTDFNEAKTKIIDLFRQSDTEIIIGLNKRDPELFDAYRLDFVDGKLEMLVENPGNVREWMVDNAGVVRIAYADALLYRDDADSEFRKVITVGKDDTFEVRYFTSDNRRVYAYSSIGRDKIAIVEYDLNSGKEVKVLVDDPDYDAFGNDEEDHFVYSSNREQLLYAFYAAERGKLHFFDEEMEKIYRAVKSTIGDYEVLFTSFSDDFSRAILLARSDRLEGKYYLYDLENDLLEPLGNSTPWLEETKMATMKPIHFRARDGLTIHGYLMLPNGIEASNLPLVVNPHAGPQWRNSWCFDPYAQLFANRGYAVLQVNFRGSEGYGKKFMRAGFRQWGLKMQDDITDGVNWLVDSGTVDKGRIAIFGWSFGGYASLAGVTFTPDIYACGVDLWGITNYFTFYEGFPPYWKPYLNEIHERWGDPVADYQQMYDTSPVFHVENIRAPLFIAQSVNDSRVRMSQSEQLVDELEKHDKEFEYLLLQGEGHALTNQAKTVELMTRVEAFLDKHIGVRG